MSAHKTEAKKKILAESLALDTKLSRPPLDLSEIGREIRVEVGRASREMRRRRRTREFPFSGSISSMPTQYTVKSI
jgi:hypothetical protein